MCYTFSVFTRREEDFSLFIQFLTLTTTPTDWHRTSPAEEVHSIMIFLFSSASRVKLIFHSLSAPSYSARIQIYPRKQQRKDFDWIIYLHFNFGWWFSWFSNSNYIWRDISIWAVGSRSSQIFEVFNHRNYPRKLFHHRSIYLFTINECYFVDGKTFFLNTFSANLDEHKSLLKNKEKSLFLNGKKRGRNLKRNLFISFISRLSLSPFREDRKMCKLSNIKNNFPLFLKNLFFLVFLSFNPWRW